MALLSIRHTKCHLTYLVSVRWSANKEQLPSTLATISRSPKAHAPGGRFAPPQPPSAVSLVAIVMPTFSSAPIFIISLCGSAGRTGLGVDRLPASPPSVIMAWAWRVRLCTIMAMGTMADAVAWLDRPAVGRDRRPPSSSLCQGLKMMDEARIYRTTVA
jgi:hypothetical protein